MEQNIAHAEFHVIEELRTVVGFVVKHDAHRQTANQMMVKLYVQANLSKENLIKFVNGEFRLIFDGKVSEINGCNYWGSTSAPKHTKSPDLGQLIKNINLFRCSSQGI